MAPSQLRSAYHFCCSLILMKRVAQQEFGHEFNHIQINLIYMIRLDTLRQNRNLLIIIDW